MSDTTEEGEFEVTEFEPSPGGADGAGGSGLDEVLSDLFAAIEELGLASGEAEAAGSVAAGWSGPRPWTSSTRRSAPSCWASGSR